jgi:DNA-binding response OmpR family regulator
MQPISCKKIMLVEPDMGVGAMIVEELNAQPWYQVSWILNSDDFLDVLENEENWPPDLLVLDLIAVLGEQKERFRSLLARVKRWPPILIMLGSTPEQAHGMVSRIGLDKVQVKSFDVPHLLTCIASALGEVPAGTMPALVVDGQSALVMPVPRVNMGVAEHLN